MLFRYPFLVMGSGCELLLRTEDQRFALSAVQSALRLLRRMEEKYSFFRPESYLSRINQEAAQREVELDEETAWLLHQAGQLHAESAGGYDPTVGTLAGCWDFKRMKVPTPRRLAASLEGVGWRHVELGPRTLRLHHPRTRLDLGGLVKECAVDVVVASLQALGVERGIVNLGGDLRAIGKVGLGERPYRVGIAHPRHHHATVGTLALREGAVVTSGDYQRYFLRDGRRYHHLLDPRTGYPVALTHAGVTTHAPTALEALRVGKRILLAGHPAPAGSAFVTCDLQGVPVAWRESAACGVHVVDEPSLARAG